MPKLVEKLSTGVVGQMSWRRLEEILRRDGELSPKEKIVEFKAEETFLQFRVEYEEL